MATGEGGEASDDPSCVSGGSGSGRRKRPASELSSSSCALSGGPPGRGGDYEQMETFQKLTQAQRAIIRRVVGMLDTEEDSVVITNPLQPQGPIVYVTNAWQDMCGYNMHQAVGQNPRLTQGEGTDPDTVRTMKLALSSQQPCRVRIINYRGYNREPFWNCLSVQPIFFNSELVLFAARLQDYSHRLSQLVSLQPAQFCKTGDLYQMRVRLPELRSARSLAQARIIEVRSEDVDLSGDEMGGHEGSPTTTLPESGSASGGPAMQLPPRHVKRLGFGNIALEPEYLLDRLRHECASLQLPCHAQEVRVAGAEVMRMEVTWGAAASSSAASSGVGFGGGGSSSSSSCGGAADCRSSSAVADGGSGSSSSSRGGAVGGGMAAADGASDSAASAGGLTGASSGLSAGSGAASTSCASASAAPSLAPLPMQGAVGPGGAAGAGGGVRALVHVMPDGSDGTYSISLMRLVGDTFEFHALYRSLRERLADITTQTKMAR